MNQLNPLYTGNESGYLVPTNQGDDDLFDDTNDGKLYFMLYEFIYVPHNMTYDFWAELTIEI